MKTENGLRKTLLFTAVFITVQLCVAGLVSAADYAIGADLSFLKETEDDGTVFKEND